MQRLLILIFGLLLIVNMLLATEISTNGAKLGEWTQDYEAGLKLAKKSKNPIILNFTGSTWCKYCIMMNQNVFSTKEWKTYAKKLVTIMIDIPYFRSKNPDKNEKRNFELVYKYSVRGYPTYIILDSTGEKILGYLGFVRDGSPKTFIASIERILKEAKKKE